MWPMRYMFVLAAQLSCYMVQFHLQTSNVLSLHFFCHLEYCTIIPKSCKEIKNVAVCHFVIISTYKDQKDTLLLGAYCHDWHKKSQLVNFQRP